MLYKKVSICYTPGTLSDSITTKEESKYVNNDSASFKIIPHALQKSILTKLIHTLSITKLLQKTFYNKSPHTPLFLRDLKSKREKWTKELFYIRSEINSSILKGCCERQNTFAEKSYVGGELRSKWSSFQDFCTE